MSAARQAYGEAYAPAVSGPAMARRHEARLGASRSDLATPHPPAHADRVSIRSICHRCARRRQPRLASILIQSFRAIEPPHRNERSERPGRPASAEYRDPFLEKGFLGRGRYRGRPPWGRPGPASPAADGRLAAGTVPGGLPRVPASHPAHSGRKRAGSRRRGGSRLPGGRQKALGKGSLFKGFLAAPAGNARMGFGPARTAVPIAARVAARGDLVEVADETSLMGSRGRRGDAAPLPTTPRGIRVGTDSAFRRLY